MCEKCAAVAELVEAECGKESTAYVRGLVDAAATLTQNLLHDPELNDNTAARLSAWVATAVEGGLTVGVEHPVFARKLLGALRYGRQIMGNHATTESAEALAEKIISGLVQEEFGWDKEKEE